MRGCAIHRRRDRSRESQSHRAHHQQQRGWRMRSLGHDRRVRPHWLRYGQVRTRLRNVVRIAHPGHGDLRHVDRDCPRAGAAPAGKARTSRGTRVVDAPHRHCRFRGVQPIAIPGVVPRLSTTAVQCIPASFLRRRVRRRDRDGHRRRQDDGRQRAVPAHTERHPGERVFLLQIFITRTCLLALPIAIVLTGRSFLARWLRGGELRYRMLAD